MKKNMVFSLILPTLLITCSMAFAESKILEMSSGKIISFSKILKTIVTQNTILSHLENKEITKIMERVSEDITDDLALNWRAYGIKDKMMLDHIENAIILPSYFSLKRALKQNEKNWLGKITLENVSGGSRMSMPKKEGFWNKLKL